jgi:DNA-binding transcriptional regulator YiaG
MMEQMLQSPPRNLSTIRRHQPDVRNLSRRISIRPQYEPTGQYFSSILVQTTPYMKFETTGGLQRVMLHGNVNKYVYNEEISKKVDEVYGVELAVLVDVTKQKSKLASVLEPISVEIEPRGAAKIMSTGLREMMEAQKSKRDLDAALHAARSRGRAKVAEILRRNDMLSADKFAALIGVSRMTVNAKWQQRQVLGLDGAKRGIRFPAWQIGEDGKPFSVLPELFDRLGGSPWEVYRFLVQHHPELGGLTGCEALRRGQTDEVVDAAESVARAFA